MNTVKNSLVNAEANRYKLVSIKRGGIEAGNVGICQNCGRAIVNYALINDQKSQLYTVGLDCLKTIMKTGKMTNFADTDEELYSFGQVLKFMANYQSAISVEEDSMLVYIKYKTRTGKLTGESMFVSTLKKYGFR